MKLIEDWLKHAKASVVKLRRQSSELQPESPEGQAVAIQIVELEKIMKETQIEGFFPNRATSSSLIKISTRENLRIEEQIIEDIGYLFEMSERAIRLGPEKAEAILKIKRSEQDRAGNA